MAGRHAGQRRSGFRLRLGQVKIPAIPVGVLFGVPVKLNLLLAVLLAALGFAGKLPQAAGLFAIVLAHEWAHTWAAQACGLPVREIELFPYGGVARIGHPLEWDPGAEMRVALAGPCANLLLAGAVHFLIQGRLFPPMGWEQEFIDMNLLLAGCNLLPAMPLDGGRVVRAFLASRIGLRSATRVSLRLGRVVTVALAAGALLGWRDGWSNWSWVALAFFLVLASRREEQAAPYSFARYLARKPVGPGRKGLLAAHTLVASADCTLKELTERFVPQRYHVVLVVDAKGDCCGVATEAAILEGVMRHGWDAPLSRVARKLP